MDIEKYLQSMPAQRLVRVKALIRLIKELYPDAIESMKYKMPTYHYQSGWVSVANQKNYVSLYTCSLQHISEFKLKHPQIKTGKGCINFTEKVELPLDDLKQVIHSAMNAGH